MSASSFLPPEWTAHSYQERGIHWLITHPEGALFWAPGLGKTSTTLAATQTPKAVSVSTEAHIERRCAEYAARYGCFLWKITAITGAPDRICLLPNGRHFFVEFKKPGGEMSAIQRHIQSRLTTMRHACFEIDNRHLFERLLHERLELPAT